MNTPTHLLMAAAAFAKPGAPRLNTAALLGGVLPDLSLYGMVFWERVVRDRPAREIFDETYFSDFWQSVFAVDNSAPLYALIAAAALLFGPWWAVALAGGALLHIATDLPLHHDDGRAHFWPFTDWIYQSPISYWDPRRYGDVVGLFETALVIALIVVLWRRFKSRVVRVLLAAAALLQASTGLVWAFVFS